MFISVVHRKPQTFSRSSGTVSIFINDECKFEGEFVYPHLADQPLIFNSFAASTHPSKPNQPFQGRLSTLTFHTRALSLAQISLLYRSGADLCIRVLNQIEKQGKFVAFVTNSLSTIFGAIGNVAAQVAQAAQQQHHAASNTAGQNEDERCIAVANRSTSRAGWRICYTHPTASSISSSLIRCSLFLPLLLPH